MKLLVINGNMTQAITDVCANAAREVASPGTEVVSATGTFGPQVIGSRSENALAQHGMLELAAKHAPGCDAVVIAVSMDTGLPALRELLSIPVVGMTEAALLTARQLGGRFGFVTFDHRSMALYRPLIESYGFGPQMAAWRVVDSRAVYTPEGARAVDEEVCAAIDDMAVRDGVEVAIISGAVMAGAGRRLQPQCSIPLVEGVAAALVQAEALVRLGAAKPRSGRYAAPQGREAIEISPALAAALRGTQGAQG